MRTSLAATARRFLRWEFVPEAVLLLGLSVFFVHQNDAATSAFKSTKALGIMAAATVGWLAARVVLARVVRFAPARAAVFSVAAAVALSVVVFPAYDNETVVESFPTAVAAPAPPVSPAATAPMPAPPAEVAAPMVTAPALVAPPKKPASAPTTSTTAAAAPAPATEAAAAAPPTAPSTQPVQPEPSATVPAEPAPAATPAGPHRLRAGAFRGIDHRASGTAAIYRQPDGRYVIGLEDIDIQPGPDYDLYIVPGADRKDTKGGVRLGDLRGNRGTLFYDVPAGVDVENGPWTVLIWCQTFAVPVANATPS